MPGQVYLQDARDLGGAIMQSTFGTLLTAGYASAVTKLIATSPDASHITDSTQAALTKSFAARIQTFATQYPAQANAITAAARRPPSSTARAGPISPGSFAITIGATI